MPNTRGAVKSPHLVVRGPCWGHAQVSVSVGKPFGRIIKIHKVVYNLSLSPLECCPLGYYLSLRN